jgi:hypothetical protein
MGQQSVKEPITKILKGSKSPGICRLIVHNASGARHDGMLPVRFEKKASYH